MKNRNLHFGLSLRLAAMAMAAICCILQSPSELNVSAQEPGVKQRDGQYQDELKTRQRVMLERFPGRVNDADYARSLMAAAARERTANAHLMPGAPISRSASSLFELWGNLGPRVMDPGPMDSGRLVSIVTHPTDGNVIYVASAGGGVWKTTNGGNTWTPRTELIGSLGCGALAMDPANPNTLYLGLGDPIRYGFASGLSTELGTAPGLGVLKSTDGGVQWSAPALLGDSTSIRSIVVSPANSNLILVGTDKGLYRSNNAGASYQLELLDGQTPEVWSVAWAGGNDFVLSSDASFSGGQIWTSHNNGNSWSQAAGYSGGLGRITLAVAPSNRNVQYALATSNSGGTSYIFKSTNGGSNWSSLNVSSKNYSNFNESVSELMGNQGRYNQMAIVHPDDPNTAYFGGQLRLAKTTNGGSSFSLVNSTDADDANYAHPDFHCAAFDDNNRLYVGNDGGIFKSSNGGASWTDVNEGLVTHLVYGVASSIDNPNVILAALQDNGIVFSQNNSATYTKLGGGDGLACVLSQENADKLIVATNGGVYWSDDGGVSGGEMTYPGIASGKPNYWDQCPCDPTGRRLYVVAGGKVYVSGTFGKTWLNVPSNGLPDNVRWVRSSRVPGVLAVLAGLPGDIYYSFDYGAHWTKAATPPNADGYFLDLAIGPDLQFYVISDGYKAGKSRIWTSNDPQSGWFPGAWSGMPKGVRLNIIKADPVQNGVIYVGTDLGLYRSGNKGLAFERWGYGLPLVSVSDLWIASDGSMVRAGTYGRGVWQLVVLGGHI